MFTGIIESMGSVKKFTRHGEDAILDIDASMILEDIKVGDSIAINGACLTVTRKSEREFTADVSAETLSRTNLRLLKPGDRVNLEKALRLNSFLGGHLVLGHVDGLGKILEKVTRSNSVLLGMEIDMELGRLIVEKGSVAVDGVSLTVNRCEKNRFYVTMIPQTARMTTLGIKKVADRVNIETDIIGKYVEKLLNPGKGIDMNFLAEHGFLK
ncbi:MAG: riboflavin synthase [Deltaproteobacteria bacterium]|nr:riboflavin synthase [Deltaproteobacteria bacterium]